MHRIGLKRRHLLGAAALALPATARAQSEWPTRPIRLVVTFAPGGSSDLLARLVGRKLGEVLGQTVVVENRAGAGGTLGMQQVSRMAADGYTIVQGTAGSTALTPLLMQPPPFDPVRDLAPIVFLSADSNLVFINAQIPARSMAEFIAWVRAQPNPVPYGSAGSGSPGHYGMELMVRANGLAMTHVPYRGAAPAVTDVVAGVISAIFTSASVGKPLVDAGRLRALAVTGPRRLEAFPGVPTVAEAGVPMMDVPIWFGYFAPPGTPAPVMARLHAALTGMQRDAEFLGMLRGQLLMEPFRPDQTLADAPAFLADQVALSRRIIETTGVRLDP